jgi:hypothetical protein
MYLAEMEHFLSVIKGTLSPSARSRMEFVPPAGLAARRSAEEKFRLTGSRPGLCREPETNHDW